MGPEEKDPQAAAAAAAPPPPEANAAAGEKEEDPERKKKKEEKAREKELKKQKAAEKAAKAKAATAAAASAEPSKKAEAKAKKAAAAAAGAGAGEEADAVNPPTEPGQKKNLAKEMAKAYNPKAVEASWYEWWEHAGFFKGDNQSTKPHFVIVVPPPNVTGALHIGHGLTAAVEDTIVRWKRMSGYNVCWVPGTDHAGIATQVVVEKKIMREKGLSRHDVGREDFVKEVWKWKEDYGDRIGKQQRKMGASLDWSRECFTMDDKLSRAVTEAFVRLHDQGLIYRDNRLVNWDCVLRTAISDIEVEYHELKGRTLLPVPGYDKPVEFGAITSFAYPLEADSAQGEGAPGAGSEGALTEIVVATTRPETMLGDTAVAVHPDDPRYKALHGKFAVHPFSGRRIQIVCDAELVDMTFGTGAVKITPAHDPNDFATGKRHNLEFINIFTDDGLINANGGKEFEGMKRFDARTAVLEKLQEKGLYRGVADNPMRLGFCSRSKDIIEPMLKPQWYVSCADVAADACQAVRDGQLEFIPKAHEETWFRWLENIRDWCISRQLWWGHRIPAWYVTFDQSDEAAARDFPVRDFGAYNTNWVVARTDEDARRAAEKKFPGRKFELGRDPDVLDTWFSSGLFPFSVFGWPEESADFKAFYPTALLETGHDILFFWVARMVFMGLRLTGQLPFKQVYLHAMVRDAHGRKMSKSLGNVIDPLEVINGITLQQLQANLEKGNLDPREVKRAQAGQAADFPNGIAECGCDALRFALVNYTTQWMNINLDIQRVHGYRLWCNKLWNAIRFAMLNLGDSFTPPAVLPEPSPSSSDPSSSSPPLTPTLNFAFSASLPLACRWILSVLNAAVTRAVTALEGYDLAEATNAAYAWWQYQLCDVFIEMAKPAFNAAEGEEALKLKQVTREVLWVCLDAGLRLLHPFMPFVTEELWQRLPKPADYTWPSIMLAPYPSPVKEWADPEAEAMMATAESAVRSIRSLRMAYALQPKQRPTAYAQCKSEAATAAVTAAVGEIKTLATLAELQVLPAGESAPAGCAVAIVDESLSVHVLLRGMVDAKAEAQKLGKRKNETAKLQEALAKKMGVPGYEEKVPANVREENASKAAKLAAELASIDDAIKNFEKLMLDEASA
ncbi:unnamed protein product [Closterium sp. Yama58-4]|nr:unnamed protein product [Closterium sp. Yama58-4]